MLRLQFGIVVGVAVGVVVGVAVGLEVDIVSVAVGVVDGVEVRTAAATERHTGYKSRLTSCSSNIY